MIPIAKCASCDAAGRVPDHPLGPEIACGHCKNTLRLTTGVTIMELIKHTKEVVLDGDSIEIFACPRCPVLGVRAGNHASRFFRCPDCKALCSAGIEAGAAHRVDTS